MNTMKLIAMPALVALVLSACGGGGGMVVPAMPETPAAVPVVVAEPESERDGEAMPEGEAALEVVPLVAPELKQSIRDSVRAAAAVGGESRLLAENARRAAISEPQRGSLHQSSAPGTPIEASGFVLNAAYRTEDIPGGTSTNALSYTVTHHYHDETYIVDYDGDGLPEHRLSVEEDSWVVPRISERAGCSVSHGGSVFGGGRGGGCAAVVGQPDGFMLWIYRSWIEAGVYGKAQPRYDVTRGWWHDRETGHVGVYWEGPTVDDPRPLEQPIHASVHIAMAGHSFLPNGELVQTQANGRLTFDVQESAVTLELGRPEQVHHAAGITLVGLDGSLEDFGYPDTEQIGQVFVYKEHYDPQSSYFGIGEQQRSRENDVVSGNGRGQFGGVITTAPGLIIVKDEKRYPFNRLVPSPGLPAVFGTVGLTDIEGWEGLSLIMSFESGFDPCRPERIWGRCDNIKEAFRTTGYFDRSAFLRVAEGEEPALVDKESLSGPEQAARDGLHGIKGDLIVYPLFNSRYYRATGPIALDAEGTKFNVNVDDFGILNHDGWVSGYKFNAFRVTGIEESGVTRYYAYSGGLFSGSNPAEDDLGLGTAAWEGAMVGVSDGYQLTGRSTLIYDFSSATIDVRISGMRAWNKPQTYPDLMWEGLDVRNGAFTNKRDIRGRLYGPNHEEAGGVFDRNNIIGAFGAKRAH